MMFALLIKYKGRVHLNASCLYYNFEFVLAIYTILHGNLARFLHLPYFIKIDFFGKTFKAAPF